jgi:hypothetical protein
MRFRHRFTTLGGESDTRELSVAELRRECEPLWLYSQHCARCPAALEQHPYSCLQSIAFPISARAQAWLVGQLAPEGSRVFELFMEAASRKRLRPIEDLRELAQGRLPRGGRTREDQPRRPPDHQRHGPQRAAPRWGSPAHACARRAPAPAGPRRERRPSWRRSPVAHRKGGRGRFRRGTRPPSTSPSRPPTTTTPPRSS